MARFRSIVAIDTNVILEGKPLAELPWGEIDADGPILVLLMPTLLKEVDAKKRDGRIGGIAREFNRSFARSALNDGTAEIKSEEPRVECRLASCSKIAWDQYDDLDSTDGDSRLVAEILNIKDVIASKVVLISQDLNPLMLAQRHGIGFRHVSEHWLRRPEPSAHDREIVRLKQRIREYAQTQPTLDVSVTPANGEQLTVFRLEELAPREQRAVVSRILELHPKPRQQSGLSLGSQDPTLDTRYQVYRRRQVPRAVAAYHRKLEILYCQWPFSLRIENTSGIPANNLHMSVYIKGGWVQEDPILVDFFGPPAPSPRSNMDNIFAPHIRDLLIPRHVARHEVSLGIGERAEYFEAQCQEFRQGQCWSFDGVLGVDARCDEWTPDLTIEVQLTASNLHGRVQCDVRLKKTLIAKKACDLLDFEGLITRVDAPIGRLLQERLDDPYKNNVEIDKTGLGDDDWQL